MANKDNIKRLRDLAAGKLREADLPTLVGQVGRTVAEQARAVDLGHAIAAMDGAMDEANLRNGKGEISKWRIARAATRPTATGKRLVSGAAHGAAESARRPSGEVPASGDASITAEPVDSSAHAIIESLRQLKALHDEGILTDDEYQAKRQRLADQL